MSSELFGRHRAVLDVALAALATRSAFSLYSADPADCNEFAVREGREAFANYCDSYFYLDQPGVGERIGEEVSPYGFALGIQYPKTNLNTILPAASRAMEAWSREHIDTRAGVCLEILHQLQIRSFELGLATMHTTGAPFDLAYRYGGAYAQERGLEALALAYQELRSIPAQTEWERPHAGPPERYVKTFRTVGLGVGLIIGCSTQPNWSAYPAFFADLMAGNAVVVKPHPHAVLPLAITVGVARHVLKEAGLDSNLVTLVVDQIDRPIAQHLAARAEVRLIDFTGNSAFAAWLTENARQARVHTLCGAVNPVVIDSTDDLEGMLGNLARSVCEFGGRLCTSPRVILMPRTGVATPGGLVRAEDFDELLAQQFAKIVPDAEHAARVIGAFRRDEFDARVAGAAAMGEVVIPARAFDHPDYPGAASMTPTVVRLRVEQAETYMQEWFGPVVFVVECESTVESIERAAAAARTAGALVASVYCTDRALAAVAEEALAATGATVCMNFTGLESANHPASFSDFHGSGVNPAGNVVLTDSRFVVNRFKVISIRSMG